LSVKDSIKSLNFFSSLNNQQINDLISISTINSYDENYILYYEKKQNTQLIFLLKGLAKAYKIDKQDNEIFLYYIYENSIISEISNLENDYLSSFSNIELIQKSKILSIDYKQFKKLFSNNNLLNKEFTNEIISHSKKLQALVNREFIFDSVSKVAMMIDSNLDMFNKLQRNNISLILHINPATLSRVLNRLKRNKIIDIIHGKVIVLNMLELKAIFEG
jgi:CRP/FNR family transcriptional regulator